MGLEGSINPFLEKKVSPVIDSSNAGGDLEKVAQEALLSEAKKEALKILTQQEEPGFIQQAEELLANKEFQQKVTRDWTEENGADIEAYGRVLATRVKDEIESKNNHTIH